MTKISKLLKTNRKKARISQNKLGELLGLETGQLISNIERSKCGLPLELAKKACGILNISEKEMYKAIKKDLDNSFKERWNNA